MDGNFPALTKLHGGSSNELPADFADVRGWVETYLAQPNTQVGRSGPVCPFTPPSIDKSLLWISRVPGDHDPSSVTEMLRELVKQFLDLEPADGRDSLLKAVILTFPGVADYGVIDEIQRSLKPDFIRAGLMIGQFYPGCTEPGLWNPDFRPLSSPMPLIAIRHMVSSDFPFLTATPEWIEIYLRRFAPGIPGAVRASLAQGFDAN